MSVTWKNCTGDPILDYAAFEDVGCKDLAKRTNDERYLSCLTCPAPICRYDDPAGPFRMLTFERNEEMFTLRRTENLGRRALAQRFGLSERTVGRILKTAGLGGRA